MTYKTGDLRYHDHEHGPECPVNPIPPDTSVPVDSPLQQHYGAYARHFEEFSVETRGKAYLRHRAADVEIEIGGVDEVSALIDDLECLVLNIDRDANEERRSLSWALMTAAFDFGLIERDEADDSPKPKEFGGAKALANLLINRIREDQQTIARLQKENTHLNGYAEIVLSAIANDAAGTITIEAGEDIKAGPVVIRNGKAYRA